MIDLSSSEYPAAPSGTGQPQPAGRAMLAVTVGVIALVLVLGARMDRQAPAPRSSRRVELVELIQAEQAHNARLALEIEDLRTQVTTFDREHSADDHALTTLRDRVEEAAVAAGLTAVEGPGVAVALTDSSLNESPTGDLNDLVIHEQNLQAVINALWAGGADAMSVNGQRVLGTTAIRCVGNTLLLHGRVYSPPYEVHAIGDPAALASVLEQDPAMARFRTAVARFDLGFAVTHVEWLRVSAHEGSVSMRTAQSLEAPATAPGSGGNT
jgi:uncharacterized protein YlxW (UPF0749 family)